MKYNAMAGGKWSIAKIIMAILSFIWFIYMLCAAANMINANDTFGREITSADYSNLNIGENVCGTLNDIIMEYQGDSSIDDISVSYYLVKSDDDKLITFRTVTDSKCDKNMKKLLSGETDEVLFRGYVKEMKDANQCYLNFQRIADNTLNKNNIDGNWSDILIKQVVDITEYNNKISNKMITATFAGAAIMLIITVLLLRKFVKNAIYSIYEAKGKIKPEVNLKPEKKPETEEFFDGNINKQGYFYIGYEEEDKNSDENNF